MKPSIASLPLAAILLAATALAGCASIASSSAPAASAPVAGSPVVPHFEKLAKGLTGAQVRALFGAPATTKPLSAGGLSGEIWSYPVRTDTDVRPVAVATQEVPAVNPRTGQAITVTEPVYQNETVNTTDTLHLLLVDDQLIEWRVVRDEKNTFH